MDGADPESVQVTVNAVPPATEAPAAGTVNLTSASARGKQATSKLRAFNGRMLVMCVLFAKRVTWERCKTGCARK
jgi:hypothetical protein